MSEKVGVRKYQVEPLNSGNYYIWSRKIELVLRWKGLWTIVTGEEEEPERDSKDLRSFRQRKDQALSTILMAIEDSYSAMVIDMRDPEELWEVLRTSYKAVSEAAVDAYFTQYEAVKLRLMKVWCST